MPLTVSFTIHSGLGGVAMEWHDLDFKHDEDEDEDANERNKLIACVLRKAIQDKVLEILSPLKAHTVELDWEVSEEFAMSTIRNTIYRRRGDKEQE